MTESPRGGCDDFGGDRPLWRHGLPVLTDGMVTLREVELRDAAALFEAASSPDVEQHIARPPSTQEGFRHFIRWARRERRNNRHASFAVIPAGHDAPVGLIQMWPIGPGFHTAEWGALVDPHYWGSEVFVRGSLLLFAYAFGELGVRRLEARACLDNQRGHAALRKLGARQEMSVHGPCRCGCASTAHVMWSILAEDWRAASRSVRGVA